MANGVVSINVKSSGTSTTARAVFHGPVVKLVESSLILGQDHGHGTIGRFERHGQQIVGFLGGLADEIRHEERTSHRSSFGIALGSTGVNSRIETFLVGGKIRSEKLVIG